MKKLILLFLGIFGILALSCSSGLDPEVASRSGDNGGAVVGVGSSPEDLISIDESGASTSASDLKAFIRKYNKTYYDNVNEYPSNIQYVIQEPLRLAYCIGAPTSKFDMQVSWFVPQIVSPSANKLQISNYARGEVRVLNMKDDGLESYASYILKKVSERVLIKNKGIGGRIPSLAKYKGTYSSIAPDNKVENYISIDKDGNIYFHDTNVSILNGNAIIGGERLTIWESGGKTVFKFDQGVYRRYGTDGRTDLGYIKCYNYYKRVK